MAAPALTAELMSEIILRLPPDDPACLVRGALVCKLWRGIITDPAFPGRYREFHRTPPLLGFFFNPYCGSSFHSFIPVTDASPFTHPVSYSEGSRVLDCRHGRVLLNLDHDKTSSKLAVWDPITGDRQELHNCRIYSTTCYKAAVACGVDGCDHLACHGGPFIVVFVCRDYRMGFTRATVYSSKTGSWSTPALVHSGVHYFSELRNRVALVGDEFYFMLETGARMVKYHVGEHCLSMVDPPDNCGEGMVLVPMEDGSMGLAGTINSTLYMWSMKVNSDGIATWERCRVMELGNLFPDGAFYHRARVSGFAEGVGVIIVSNGAGTLTIELKSGQVRNIYKWPYDVVFPFLSFYGPDFPSTKLPLLAESD